MIKNIFSVFFGLFLTISYAKADAVDDWLAGLKSKFSGTELVFAMTSHPGTDGIQALVPEFTEKSGIKINEFGQFYDYCKKLELEIIGTMCLPPEEKDPSEIIMEEALILIEKRKEYDRNKRKKR